MISDYIRIWNNFWKKNYQHQNTGLNYDELTTWLNLILIVHFHLLVDALVTLERIIILKRSSYSTRSTECRSYCKARVYPPDKCALDSFLRLNLLFFSLNRRVTALLSHRLGKTENIPITLLNDKEQTLCVAFPPPICCLSPILGVYQISRMIEYWDEQYSS